ncbi:DUF4232 domain-containing protein [Streptomyces sp. B-S-A8]|uniref:DUF4232 domain-containing protein n=1 Tax=Streptomyces solicavernae TaxID=3043614 RepID=A0ABT6RZR6_9ACTN|nr:DUF4232 domain-containing protein [Streptomyces sp. B-S-A8]MDI3389664.1 DUF4232 domain-containing protein [Streptomyces sp. B-S-A8]
MFIRSRHFSRRATAVSLTAALAGLAGLTAAGSAGGTTAAPEATSAPSTSRTCTVSDLYLSMGRKEGAAGSLYWPIRFTNTSTTSCTLRGFPGVSVLDTTHHQIGPAADRNGKPYDTVTIAPARTVTATVRTATGPVDGPCLRTGTYLRVYPPASYTAVLVPAEWKICSDIFQVGPVNTEGTF